MAYGPRQKQVREYRGQIPSPGRPTVAWREDRVRFWAAIATGVLTDEASEAAGVSAPVLRRPIESAQYTAADFRATLADLDVRPSVGRTGSCYDNAVAESFFATLKAEIGTTVWATRDDARHDVFSYLGYYNHNRLHSTLDHRTPTKPASAIVKASPSRHETPVSGLRGQPHTTGWR
jgi:transposase InsO family protein